MSLVLIQKINCLKCYSCEFCGDPFNNSSYPLKNCPTGFDYCTKTIYYSRAGVMPFWQVRLDDNTIKILALYIHSLGGGTE